MKSAPLLLCIAMGIALGVSLFTFRYAEGFSYMSSEPEVCVNCHIMQPQYDSWQKASHHIAANCVDCHLPHGFISKYISKAENGYHHSVAFTAGGFHEPIQIKPKNARILQENCLRCHGALVHELAAGAVATDAQAVQCTQCHSGVGHGEEAGLGGPLRAAEMAARDS